MVSCASAHSLFCTHVNIIMVDVAGSNIALPYTNSYYAVYNSYLTVIGVHEMHGQMHPNYCQITILLVVHLSSSLAHFMMTQPLSKAGKLPIKTLVARQLPTNNYYA